MHKSLLNPLYMDKATNGYVACLSVRSVLV